MQQADFQAAVEATMQTYIRLLDQNAFEEWLGLFGEDGYYAVLRDIEYKEGDNVLLIGEDLRRLSARIDSGRTRDLRRRMHAICWTQAQVENMTAQAGFMVWLNGSPSTCGRYELEFTAEEDGLNIRNCTVVLDTIDIIDTIYLPI